jgi:type IV pilus assembly protein PilM
LSLLDQIQRLVKEPPPEYIFEVSERSVAFVQPRNPSTLRVETLPEKGLTVSPSQPNITRFDLFQAALPKSTNGNTQRRAKAALIIPDYAARMTILDFEELPNDVEQQLALIRFRIRKSVPFAIDEAQVSSSIQLNDPQHKKIEVLAAAISRPVLKEYETLLRTYGFQVGLVLPSCLAALPLCSAAPGILSLFAKLSGNILSILLVQGDIIRVARCVDLTTEENNPGEEPQVISTLLHQTLAFAEDELSQPVQRLILCGFGRQTEEIGATFEKEFSLSWSPLRSRLGDALQENAGLLGMMEQYVV